MVVHHLQEYVLIERGFPKNLWTSRKRKDVSRLALQNINDGKWNTHFQWWVAFLGFINTARWQGMKCSWRSVVMFAAHNYVARQTGSFIYVFASTFVHFFCFSLTFVCLFLSFSLVTVRAFRESMRQCEQQCTVHPSFLRSDYALMTVTHPNPVQSSLMATQPRRLGHKWTNRMVQTMRRSKILNERSRVDTWQHRDRFKSIYKIITLSPKILT